MGARQQQPSIGGRQHARPRFWEQLAGRPFGGELLGLLGLTENDWSKTVPLCRPLISPRRHLVGASPPPTPPPSRPLPSKTGGAVRAADVGMAGGGRFSGSGKEGLPRGLVTLIDRIRSRVNKCGPRGQPSTRGLHLDGAPAQAKGRSSFKLLQFVPASGCQAGRLSKRALRCRDSGQAPGDSAALQKVGSCRCRSLGESSRPPHGVHPTT